MHSVLPNVGQFCFSGLNFEFELITGQAAMADLSSDTAQVYNYKKIINND